MNLDLSAFLAIFQTACLLAALYVLVRFTNSTGSMTWSIKTTRDTELEARRLELDAMELELEKRLRLERDTVPP